MAKNTVKELTPRAKESIILTAQKAIEKGLNAQEAIKAIAARLVKLGLVENDGKYNQMLSVALSCYNMEKAKKEGKKPLEVFPQYAAFKQTTTNKLSDYGAFADMWEILLRMYTKPEWAIQFSDMHVKRQYDVDITIRGKKCEVGTNGKTFAESTEEEASAGRYDYILYTVLDDDEKQAFFRMVKTGRVKEAMQQAARMTYCFEKNQFFSLLSEKCGRAPMVKYKETAGYWQVIYNPSKHTAFLKMVEAEKIPTLDNWIKSL